MNENFTDPDPQENKKCPDPDPQELEKYGFDIDKWRLLKRQVFPSATDPEVVLFALARCKNEQLNPFTKPFAIIPIYDKSLKRYVDILCDTIGYYRIRAHRTGVYVGKSEAQFGPIVDLGNEKEPIRGPEWAMVTVRRSVGSVVGEWSEKLYLAETRAKNKMWRERPHFMLAKCAEASALRAAFPELDLRYIEEEMMGQNLAGSATFEPSPKLSAFVDRVISRCSGTGNWEGGKQILHDRLEDDQLAWAMEQLRAASMTLEHVAA
ncbi:MAG: hypothetical protein CMO30_08875 [Tistrella sp.]|uniref:recombinase RecT n=1 Tax=Tistrella sp. TaxID=2024861 RepID=UPI000C5EF744|nr:recombinase RecT [Tistrella sp.]MAD35248.1 hypothetical protein [Tistrella sp.]MBA75380.1 hypothetical protein [Tistrella sp.]|tara:strand:- start:10539 stop:11333 length:795 start_codon:yes stop_codon:yes gene_type:complete